MTGRKRTTICLMAVICAGLLVSSLAWPTVSLTARRLMAGLSEGDSAGRPAILFDESGVSVEGIGRARLERLKEKNLSSLEWASLFAVYPGETIPEDVPAMACDYSVEGGAIRFTPRYPMVAGLTYAAQFDASRLASMMGEAQSEHLPLRAYYRVPRREASGSVRVVAVYPSGDELPVNQLKLYIEFSGPMMAGEAYDRIRLLDERGREAPKAFLRLDQELWDPGRRRLTLWFDPGRIKRGLRPNLEMGTPLEEGRRYRFVIDSEWRDENGNPLAQSFEKAFTVTGADRKAPDWREWKILAPLSGTREPLRIVFPEPLDRALLENSLDLLDHHGVRVEGAVEVGDMEREWRVIPAVAWDAGSYAIEVDARLEDRAGNNLLRSFDSDLKRSKPLAKPAEKITLQFNIHRLETD